MSEFHADSKCQGCGAPLPNGASSALCFDCLGKVGLDSTIGDGSEVNGEKVEGLQQFGDYDIQGLLGQGGMGVVYRAFQTNLRRPVALKLLSDLSPKAVRQFHIGAEAAAKLDHPNIVPIFDHGAQLDRPYLSMKLVEGESLRRQISGGAFKLGKEKNDRIRVYSRQEKIARLMVTVAEAVHHAHENGVVHRDLKPGNILIDTEGRPQIVDFGLAEIVDEQRGSKASGLAGTPAYMSPEQVNEERAKEASDIYSLGAVLYELLTGKPPFQANTLTEIFTRISSEEPRRPRTLNPNIDADLETICLKCLEKEPRRRYASAEVLAAELNRWLRGEPILARPVGPVMRARKWVKRNRLGTALIVTLVLGLLTLSALLIILATTLQGLSEQRYGLLSQWQETVRDRYGSEETTEVDIPSAMLRIMAGLEPMEGRNLELTLGMIAQPEDQPAVVGLDYHPLTVLLEAHMSRHTKQDIVLGLRLYKPTAFDVAHEAFTLPSFLLLDFGTYLRHRTNLPAMTPILVSASQEEEAALIVPLDSPIRDVADLSLPGFRFATSRPGECVWIQLQLVRKGLDPRTVRSFCIPSSAETHSTLVRQVVSGSYPGAIISRSKFHEYESMAIRMVQGLDGLSLPRQILLLNTASETLTPAITEAWRAAASDIELRESLGPQFTGAVNVMDRLAPLEEGEVEDRVREYQLLE